MKKLIADKTYHIPELADLVESISFFENTHDSDEKDILFKSSPEGIFELVIQDNNTVWQKDLQDSVWRQRAEAFIGGLHQQSYQLRLSPGTEIMSVRFLPGAFKYVFSGRLNDFMNAKIPITDVWEQSGRRLFDSIKNQDSRRGKIELLAAFIVATKNDNKRSVIDQCVEEIINTTGKVSLENLELQSHLSSAQFRKRFREEVGLAPKKYAKIIRINAIIKALEQTTEKDNLVNLAYAFDYFDQSHFIKDFKSVLGQTPSQYQSASV